MSAPLRVAVVGVGSMGANHARVLANRDDVDLVGVCDARLDAAQRVARRHRVAAYDSMATLLSDARPEAVCIAVPTSLHFPVSQAAIDAGVHVLLEKPIATTVDEGRQIIELARRRGVKLLIGHIERYNPAVQELRNKVRAGLLGEIYRIEVDRQGPFPKRIFDIGVSLDLAVHDLDIIGSLVDQRPTRVYCHTQQLLHQNHEDAMLGLLEYPSGIVAMLNINWTTPVKRRQLRVYGRKGMLSVDYLTQDLHLVENPAQQGEDTGWGPLGIEEGNMVRFHLAKQEPLAREIDFFIQSIRGNVDLSESQQNSLDALALTHRLLESADRRTPLDA